MNCFDSYCRQIIRPPRRQYMISDLGPKIRFLQTKAIVRVDFVFESRNIQLNASYFLTKSKNHRCMIYLHGNASCRLEGIRYAEVLASWDINLCVLDFAACGMSKGDFITMGVYESQDVIELMKYIENNFGKVDEFMLWGRSMGAVTALLLTENSKIRTYIVDSAFSEFRQLLQDIGNRQFGVFSFVLYLAIPILRRKIMNQAQFDINLLKPIDKLKQVIPNKKFFFVAGKSDNLISYQYTLKLYENCQMPKKLDICEGDHNSNRPSTTLQRIIEFINEACEFKYNQEYQIRTEAYFKFQNQHSSEEEEDSKLQIVLSEIKTPQTKQQFISN
ncbi:unnamed protein product [Paramecium octaurelia]|uniref:Serine aminopeptidase S33 domain-containing protein n=1 Tax=Paramecium octaurelia TaxID=43137 RepID=A0A8S1VEN4_PAROT|nr:unnamed protein product [Paramecium octaurelia]